jgi:hypothetical protein
MLLATQRALHVVYFFTKYMSNHMVKDKGDGEHRHDRYILSSPSSVVAPARTDTDKTAVLDMCVSINP